MEEIFIKIADKSPWAAAAGIVAIAAAGAFAIYCFWRALSGWWPEVPAQEEEEE